MEIVQLQATDLPDLMRLKEAAGWNQTGEDWLRCLKLAPIGSIGISDAEHKIISSATNIRYGENLSWIGMVLTHPDFRGHGLARKLMEYTIKISPAAFVRLDASDMGKPLYDSLGFVGECAIERWVRVPETTTGPDFPEASVDASLDKEVFGADRSELLADLARVSSASFNSGYAFARPGSNYHFFGPCVAEDPADAAALLRWFVARHGDGPACMDLFPHNEVAAKIAREQGFQPARRLTRMVLRPAEPKLPDERIFAAAGFEFG